MATNVDIVNQALFLIGSRVTISSLLQDSVEAQTANLIFGRTRDELNRMAPWDCATKFANLNYITSLPTTPENATAGPPQWQPGMPAPPWAYEYQYPVDCLRARYIIPQFTATGGGIPIYPPGTVTGANLAGYTGPALKFKVSTDSFYSASAAAITNAGTGYAVGDLIYLEQPSYTFTQNYPPLTNQVGPQTFTMPVGAPAVLQVTTIGGSGAITGVNLVNQIYGEDSTVSDQPVNPLSGSYFQQPISPVPQDYAIGANGQVSNGTSATFTLSMSTLPLTQRVVLCNQEDAILCYNAVVTDPNVVDPLFRDAWTYALAAKLAYSIIGDKVIANVMVAKTNEMIMEARKVDGNEGITVNDVMPDFLRVRGNWGGPSFEFSPNMSFDWGSFYSPF